jgi:hypothetical protein
MVGIMNAVNLIDGMDGLCSGTAAIITFFALLIALYSSHKNYLFLGVAPSVIGATLGFLYFNKTPAKIFLGDSGSLTIGFFLAAASIELMIAQKSLAGILACLFFLGHPIIDTLSVMYLRLRSGKSMFSGDRNHLHHRIHRLGLKTERAVLLLWTVSIYLGIQAVLLITAHSSTRILVILSTALFLPITVTVLKFIEKSLSVQMTRFGHARSELRVPPIISANQFLDSIRLKYKQSASADRGFSLLVIDYMKIMPQMLHETPERIAEFFRESHQIIKSNIRSDTFIARLSETKTAIFLETKQDCPDTGEAIARRISEKLQKLQYNFNIMMSDQPSAEGILLISDFRQILNYCIEEKTKAGLLSRPAQFRSPSQAI